MTPLDLRGLDLDNCPTIELDDLCRIEDPCVIFHGEHLDSDGAITYVYTVGGMLNGQPVEQPDHVRRLVRGALVGGDAILIGDVKSRAEADAIACAGLEKSIVAHANALAKQSQESRRNEGLVITSDVRRTRH